jgi:iron complex outermembrane recepter protein
MRPSLLLSSALVMFAAYPVAASELGALDAAATDEMIVVYGARESDPFASTKSEAPLIETPQSISVVTEDVIDDQLLFSQAELLRNVPSVGRSQNQGNVGGSQNNTIRGFNTRSVYKDGARYGTIGEVYLDNIDRVEVLKGPASMLFGVTPPGGLIAYTRKKPQAEWAAEAEIIGGSDDFINPSLDVTGPLTAGGALQFRLIGSYYSDGVFIDTADREAVFVNPSLRFQQGDLTVDLTYERAETDETFIYGLPLALLEPSRSLPRSRFLGHPENIKKTTDEAVSLNLAYEVDERTTVRALAHDTRFTHESYAYRPGTYNIAARTYTPIGSLRPPTDSKERSAELNVTRGFTLLGMEHMLLVGGDVRRQYSESVPCNGNRANMYTASIDAPNYMVASPRLLSCTTPGFVFFDQSETVQHEYGAYVQDDIWLTERLKLLAGLRYSRIERESENISRNTVARQNDEDATGRLGLLYKLTDDASAYVSYSESFEQLVGTAADGSTFEPTRGRQYEAGIKLGLFEAATLNLALFDIRQTNLTVPDLANPGFSVQLGEVTSKGAEVELSGSVLPRLELVGGFGYLDNEIIGGPNDGNRLANVYKTKGSLWALYTAIERDELLWTLGGGVFYHGSSFISTVNDRRLPAAALVDLATTVVLPLASGQLALQLNVKNLFDKLDYTGGFGTGAGATVYPEPGRQVFLRASYSF